MAPPKKRPSRRQRRNRTDMGLVEAVSPVTPIPAPDRAWLKGSQGQPRLNPAAKYVLELEGSVRALEDRFGLTPKAGCSWGSSSPPPSGPSSG
jgi:hypothetical protein